MLKVVSSDDSNAESSKRLHPLNERVLSIEDLAAFLRVCEQTIRRMSKDGRLPKPIRIGNRLRWFESDIQDFYSIKGSIIPD